jgi:glycosyltransferase involved in cell wall biosynthesis
MQLIHIIENIDNSYGGPARSVPLLVKYLNKLHIKNKIFTVKVYENETNTILETNDIDVIKVPLEGFKKIKYSSKLEDEIIKEINRDTIIHVHTVWTYPAYIGYEIAKKYNLPLIVSTRGTMYKWALNQSKLVKSLAMIMFQKNMLKTANIIHITESNERKALEDIGVYNKTVIIPNAIELDNKFYSLDDDILNKINYDTSKRYIMFLGRIVHNKGLHYLINSYVKLKDKYSDVEILVIGGVEDKSYFEDIEKVDGVHFLGELDGIKKHTLFSISSLFVLPSRTENFGMVIAEAMSYKIPVITTKGTPWQEIKDKDAGWWVELSQVNIDNALEEALQCSKKELKAKGCKSFDIIKHYTWDKQALKMKQTYENILNNKMKNKQCIY